MSCDATRRNGPEWPAGARSLGELPLAVPPGGSAIIAHPNGQVLAISSCCNGLARAPQRKPWDRSICHDRPPSRSSPQDDPYLPERLGRHALLLCSRPESANASHTADRNHRRGSCGAKRPGSWLRTRCSCVTFTRRSSSSPTRRRRARIGLGSGTALEIFNDAMQGFRVVE